MEEPTIPALSKSLGLAAALLCVAPAVHAASAAPDPGPVSEAFGKTIVSTYADGRKAELWLSPDGAYAGEGRRHDRSSGHWRVSNGKLCLKQARPVPAPFSYCTPLPSGGLHTAWQARAPSGDPITVSIVRGRTG